MKTKDDYKKELIQALSEMGLYRIQYNFLIDSLSLTMEMRDRNLQEWKATGFQQVQEHTNKGGATNKTKSQYFDNHIKYTDQILKYMRTIGLTPADSNRLGIAMSEEDEEDDLIV